MCAWSRPTVGGVPSYCHKGTLSGVENRLFMECEHTPTRMCRERKTKTQESSRGEDAWVANPQDSGSKE